MRSGGFGGAVTTATGVNGSANSSTMIRGTAPANASAAGFPFLFREDRARTIVEADGRLLWASPLALEIIRDSNAIQVEKSVLGGRTRHSERLLRALIDDALNTQRPVSELIGRAANEVPELYVQARSCSGKPRAAIALTFRSLKREVEELPDLTKLYHLTPTEQQIVQLMLRGHSVQEIAAELHNSVLTVRTHIKRTYVKLGVGTKEQLFSNVLKLMVD